MAKKKSFKKESNKEASSCSKGKESFEEAPIVSPVFFRIFQSLCVVSNNPLM
jgi:hypothetical protein